MIAFVVLSMMGYSRIYEDSYYKTKWDCCLLQRTTIVANDGRYYRVHSKSLKLAINVKKINDLNDLQEPENLIENIKQIYFQDYKTCYDKQKEEIDCIIPFK
ncbi:MAG TPA: hypothetical protein VFJ51_08030 [Nitrososphaeraceae archaeon]|nr:hypothetical protein [Nitrososphaeraceae archaeon]